MAHDLRTAFPQMKGFSPRNLKYMRAFAEAWPDAEFVQGVLAQLPWYHQVALLDKLDKAELRHWYAAKAIENNWSRNVLVNVGGDEFFIDLLFYHLKLRCYVVIELKTGEFKPENLGQLGFYLTAVDRHDPKLFASCSIY